MEEEEKKKNDPRHMGISGGVSFPKGAAETRQPCPD